MIAAVVLALAIAGGSFVIKSSVDNGAQELRTAFTALQDSLAKLVESGPQRPVAARPSPAPRPSRAPRPDPDKKYEVAAGDAPTKGPETAPIEIVEWSDFQCPFCGRVGPTLKQIQDEYGDKVQIAFKHMPLAMHSQARPAHEAAEAAHLQGKFWEMHDRIFGDQRNLNPQQYINYAQEIGLDVEKFEKDLKSAAVKNRIDADAAQAANLGVTGTPAFFVNGRFLAGAQPFASFKSLIDEELAKN